MLKPVSRSTLTGQALAIIKRYILHEDLKSGDQLPTEQEFSERLTVSRHIVREALSVLVAEGVIVKHAGKGTFVRDFDRRRMAATLQMSANTNGASLQDLLEFRIALEMGALELIVQRITDEEIEDITRIAVRMEHQYRQGKALTQEDIDFHLALLKATGNPLFVEMAPLVTDAYRRVIFERPEFVRSTPESTMVQHRSILRAISERDLVAAQAAMRAHLVL